MEDNENRKKRKFKELHLPDSLGMVFGDIFTTLREMITGKKTITEKNKIMEQYYSYQKGTEKKHSKYSKGEKQSFVILGITIANTLLLVILYLYKFSRLKETIFTNFIPYLIVMTILPFVGWVRATNENFWAFHKRKRVFFYLCCLNMLLILLQPVYTGIRNIVVGIVFKINTNPLLTYGMLELLAYGGILLIMGAVLIVLYSQFEPVITNQQLKRQIELFKLQHVKDDREDSEYKYDLKIVKKLENGKPATVKENDRFVQAEINGPSGTGKTSTIFLTAIRADLDQKIKNREKRQEELLRLINEHKATIKGPLAEFKESAIVPIGKNKAAYEKNKKELDKIRFRYADCGMTVIAPNNSLIEDIIRLCDARSIKVNVLDPVYNYGGNTIIDYQSPDGSYTPRKYKNAIDAAINPFYIPLGLDETERRIRISEAATVFSDVLIATNQMGGESDQYFTDISLAVSSNISTVVMLAKNIEGKQAYIEDVHNCISNFENLRDYIRIIENHYNMKVQGLETTAKNSNANINVAAMEKKEVSKNVKSNPYYQQILFVMQELLGSGGEEMFSQARGLRNLINKIVQDPRIKKRLSAEDESRIDFDGILSGNEITVVNTAIELGKSTSTAFGLFFILLHKASVLRRPQSTRTPHFLWIDEATQYMHPCYEDMIALYRQYRCAVVITLQSLNQTERSRATAYLKDVFLGAGTHFVFGRLTPEEMKLYAEMGGISREIEEQTSFTTNSVLTSSPNYSESVRMTPKVKNVLEGGDLRNLDFLELTIFTIDNGRVLPGEHGRVFFITEDAYDKQQIRDIHWERVVPEAFKIESAHGKDTSEYEYDPNKKLLRADFDEVPYSARTAIPEEETETILEKTNKESGRIVSEGYAQNLSMEEIYAYLDSGEIAEPIKPEKEKKKPQEPVADKLKLQDSPKENPPTPDNSKTGGGEDEEMKKYNDLDSQILS